MLRREPAAQPRTDLVDDVIERSRIETLTRSWGPARGSLTSELGVVVADAVQAHE